MSVVLITGAATGIGYLTAKKLAADGHTVWASMRDPESHNQETVAEFAGLARTSGVNLHTVALDVTSQESANAAVKTVVETSGKLDVVVQNAGHLYVGYVEAFTDVDIAHLLDINAVGAHRVNRAALPYLREQRSGTLLYVGSTIIVTTPPFLGPYVASKAAFDALAVVTSYEAAQFGIETSIVMPGPSPRARRTSRTQAALPTPPSPPPTPPSTRSSPATRKQPLRSCAPAWRPTHRASRTRSLASSHCRAARSRSAPSSTSPKPASNTSWPSPTSPERRSSTGWASATPSH
ncbi:SDR family NAD(P)-dependent oxidoreductase [Curtobacterium sp. VKM Ac-2887]|uniref:SDR family NAD(P)-dependent oxidoreductase n=1 Tax=Curtobacterium sp. VKM Ac-2887 TaxID=2783819 RepID=UPI001E4BE312|nr:SDR family NAD(P)-dependent oxidoreductase [Curtobacterium sp. VKM Ac-2887]